MPATENAFKSYCILRLGMSTAKALTGRAGPYPCESARNRSAPDNVRIKRGGASKKARVDQRQQNYEWTVQKRP